ncbi:hypothetical protein ACJIZ3_018800 [Penstemon smallii]|uniref:J domain-containing protein n=1 Tax=Penstemon smallii TaxID=265156 RepID=A0ABD3T0S3_9LAMI
MECNKDEANRAKEMAEKKMASNDFVGAQKIALKAKNLYPELDNISQLLSICDVHCSAQKRILGSEKDWYGILQVERLADDLTIKKQYKRLAFILHPDKNRFPGAESAFKLICEANAVLSDTAKKSLYDSKIRVLVGSAPVNRPPPHHVNKNHQFNKQNGVQNNAANGFSSMSQQKTPQFGSTTMPEFFWTSCPFCSIQYQYHRKYVNISLRCPTCSKNFMACEIRVQGIPLSSKWGQPGAHVPPKPGSTQPASFQEKVAPSFGNFNKKGVRNDKGSGSDGIRVASTWNKNEDIKDNESKNHNANSMHCGKMRGNSSSANNWESVNLKCKGKKRSRRVVIESSESFDTSSDSDIEDVTSKENVLNSATGGVHFPRRSSRKKQHISYNENDDDDIVSPLKKSEASKETGAVHPEENLQDKDAKCDKEVKERGETNGDEKIEIISDSDLDSCAVDDLDKDKFDCIDPEFSDFDRMRDPSCFEVDQFWACYDTFDGMPRFYAKVKKVFTSPFELSITWLEPVPIHKAYEDWVEKIPVGCGTFKLGKTKRTSELLTFSHKVLFKNGIKRTLTIYPQEGEVWALIKDWDKSWRSNAENIKEFKYEVVEVLSEFDEGSGIRVAYLDKVEGFKCLFERIFMKTDSFTIRPNELYKFSHLVPSFKMTGSEREGVPRGSFELDPASLPLNPDHLYFPAKAKVDS